MPRIPPSLIHKAARLNEYLPALLTECRDIPSARNELRWLTEHAEETAKRVSSSNTCRQNAKSSLSKLLSSYVNRRSSGEPLQYILGSQPFGDLEILCRRNVLIPRPETELYTTRLAGCLRNIWYKPQGSGRRGLRILDLCSGSGCIALLLHSLLKLPQRTRLSRQHHESDLQIAGLDVSRYAVQLAEKSKASNIRSLTLSPEADQEVLFRIVDVLALPRRVSSNSRGAEVPSNPTKGVLSTLVGCPAWRQDGSWDIVISNPPYISESDFGPGGSTARSVREFEPKLALVPPGDPDSTTEHGDIFYQHILKTAFEVEAKVIVMEVGDSQQASRVWTLAQSLMRDDGEEHYIELWRDDGTVQTENQCSDAIVDRVVVVWRQEWATWRRDNAS